MKLHAFVLHLTRASGRRANATVLKDQCVATRQFSQVNIWPAVDGSAMSPDEISASIRSNLFQPHYPFALKTGEVGCFLSHRDIWAEMQTREIDAAFIIEDDAGITADLFEKSLILAAKKISTLGYIQFQTRPHSEPAHELEEDAPCRLTVPCQSGLRTTAQLVSKKAAAHLMTQSDVFDRPVDTFVQSHWHTGLRPAAIFPCGVADIADQLDGTTIQAGRKTLWEKLRREAKRAKYRRSVKRLSEQSTAPETGGY